MIFFYKKDVKISYFGAFSDLKKIYKKDSFYYKVYYFLLFLIFLLFTTIISNPVIENTNESIKKN
jgi:hypothetical protein